MKFSEIKSEPKTKKIKLSTVGDYINYFSEWDRFNQGYSNICNIAGWINPAIMAQNETRILNCPVVINKRLKTTAGRSYYEKDLIQLTGSFFKNEWKNHPQVKTKLVNTFFHEVSHLIATRLLGERGHGQMWKAVFSSFGYIPRRTYKIEDVPFAAEHYEKKKEVQKEANELAWMLYNNMRGK